MKHSLRVCLAIIVLIVCLTSAPSVAAVFVKAGGSGKGTKWSDAMGDIQKAINQAAGSDEVWVAGGSYPGFSLLNGSVVKGGFAGDDLFPTLRDPSKYPSVATGPVVAQPYQDSQNNTVYVGSSTLLDGFTLNGYDGVLIAEASPTISNCTVSGAGSYGVGISVAQPGTPGSSAPPIISNCTVKNNTTTGILVNTTQNGIGTATPQIINCTIDSNYKGIAVQNEESAVIQNCSVTNSLYEGGIYVQGSAQITGCQITGNTSLSDGGGLFVELDDPQSGPQPQVTVTNCLIANNTSSGSFATYRYGGGGVFTTGSHYDKTTFAFLPGSAHQPLFMNCTIKGNTSTTNGGGISTVGSAPILVNCTITDNTAAVNGGGIRDQTGAVEDNSGNILNLVYLKMFNCVVARNQAQQAGGGFSIEALPPFLTNCTIVANSTPGYGGGIYYLAYESSPQPIGRLANCAVTGNTAPNGSTVYQQDYSSYPPFPPAISEFDNCAFLSTGTFSSNMPAPSGNGNIYVADPGYTNSGSGDYTLAQGSQLINAGSNSLALAEMQSTKVTTDLAGNPRIIGPSVDIGAYESGNGGPTITDVAQLRTRQSLGEVLLSGLVVTGVFNGYAYAEEPDRSGGIRLQTSSALNQGDSVAVFGPVSTYVAEQSITPDTLITLSHAQTVPAPLTMITGALGGHWSGLPSLGFADALGSGSLYNLDLLVRTAGVVTYSDPGGAFVYIDDGSGLHDANTLGSSGAPVPGVRVLLPSGSTAPAAGAFAVVTGISSSDMVNGSPARILRARSAADIQ